MRRVLAQPAKRSHRSLSCCQVIAAPHLATTAAFTHASHEPHAPSSQRISAPTPSTLPQPRKGDNVDEPVGNLTTQSEASAGEPPLPLPSPNVQLPFDSFASLPGMRPVPTHPIVFALARLTKAHTCYWEQRAMLSQQHCPPVHRSWSRGLEQQVQHVLWLLHHQQLMQRDFGSLAQSARRLGVVAETMPALRSLQESLCQEVIAAALRNASLAQTTLGTWSALLHGLVVAGAPAPDVRRLIARLITHLQATPVDGTLQAGVRPGLCARIVWAVVAAQYDEDATPLLRAVVAAVSAGSMRLASAAHWGTLLWSAAQIPCQDRSLLRFLFAEGLAALIPMLTAATMARSFAPHPETWKGSYPPTEETPVNTISCAVVTSVCVGLAAAGYRLTTPQTEHSGVDDATATTEVEARDEMRPVNVWLWISAVQQWVDAGGADHSTLAELDELQSAVSMLSATDDTCTQVPALSPEGTVQPHVFESQAQSCMYQRTTFGSLESGGDSESELVPLDNSLIHSVV